MTVGELLERLQKEDSNARVRLGFFGWADLHGDEYADASNVVAASGYIYICDAMFLHNQGMEIQPDQIKEPAEDENEANHHVRH